MVNPLPPDSSELVQGAMNIEKNMQMKIPLTFADLQKEIRIGDFVLLYSSLYDGVPEQSVVGYVTGWRPGGHILLAQGNPNNRENYVKGQMTKETRKYDVPRFSRYELLRNAHAPPPASKIHMEPELKQRLRQEPRIGDIILLKSIIRPGSIEDTVGGFLKGWGTHCRPGVESKAEGLWLDQNNPNNVLNLTELSNFFRGSKYYRLEDFGDFEIIRSVNPQPSSPQPNQPKKTPDDRRDDILSNDQK